MKKPIVLIVCLGLLSMGCMAATHKKVSMNIPSGESTLYQSIKAGWMKTISLDVPMPEAVRYETETTFNLFSLPDGKDTLAESIKGDERKMFSITLPDGKPTLAESIKAQDKGL